MICVQCRRDVNGAVMRDGAWWCRPCHRHDLPALAHSVAVDSIPGGLVLENYGPQPVTVYSHTERRQLMARQGLELREKFSPLPGTDIDPAGIPNPKGYVDPYTLMSGAILLTRGRHEETPDPVKLGIIANQFALVGDTDDAIAVQRMIHGA